MSKHLQSKQRGTPLTTFYSLGESKRPAKISQFKQPSAEPGLANNIVQRNSDIPSEIPLSQRDLAYSTTDFAKNLEQRPKERVLEKNIPNLTVLRNVKQKQYANSALRTNDRKFAQTVTRFDLVNNQSEAQAPSKLKNSWNYITRDTPAKRMQHPMQVSDKSPEWFKGRSQSLASYPTDQNAMMLLSKSNGWITVNRDTMNRKSPIGKDGPFTNNIQEKTLHYVSDLSPTWMQSNVKKPVKSPYQRVPGCIVARTDFKRTFLIQGSPPEKSVFSIGDFRHNVMTKQQAAQAMEGVNVRPKDILHWPEDPSRQGYDVKITGKIN